MNSRLAVSGMLMAEVIRPRRPGLWWKLNNAPHVWAGWWRHQIACLLGIGHFYSRLYARLFRVDGTVIDYGLISTRMVTDAGVAFLVDDWMDDSADITDMKYHACGTDDDPGEATTDTALNAEATAATNRVAGAQTQPAANQLRSIATQSFTDTAALVEHGLFSSAVEESGTLWDRSIFSVINVGDGDSIQWTYTCTISAGG